MVVGVGGYTNQIFLAELRRKADNETPQNIQRSFRQGKTIDTVRGSGVVQKPGGMVREMLDGFLILRPLIYAVDLL